MSEVSGSPYRSGMATGLGVVLVAGLIVACGDLVHTRAGIGSLLGLWALVALPMAVGVGVVLGAGNATWGTGWIRAPFRRLREDDELDRKVAAALIAAAILGAVFAIVIGKLAVGLVGDRQRKDIGGLLLGLTVVGALPVIAFGALPIYRVTSWILNHLPSVPPLVRLMHLVVGSRVGALLVTAAAAVAGAFALVVLRGLDSEGLSLGSLLALAALPVIAVAIGILAYGPLAGLRQRIPKRGWLALGAAGIAGVLPVAMLSGSPSEVTKAAVSDRSYLGPKLVPLLQKLIDRDHDGFSGFFGGPDCDDSNPLVNQNGIDIPDNGIDENCLGGDSHTLAVKPAPDASPGKPVEDAGPPSPALRGGDNVLIIFVDTLRADRLGFAGYQRDGKSLTPHLDELAKESVVFSRAFSQAPNTPRSVPSFLSSRYPSQVKVDKVFKPYPSVLDDNDLLFEALKGGGFTTVGETSHFYFCDRKKYPDTCGDVVSWMNSNITQGADLWDNTGALNIPESNHDSAGPRTIEKATKKLEALATAKTKFAMLVHLFEPHSTYMIHPDFVKNGTPMTNVTERGSKALEQKYDFEVAFDDDMIGNLLGVLAKTGLDKSTTVVVMADHGEAFGVHVIAGKPDFFHGDSLYGELIRVPLMFRIPGAKPCKRDDVVQLVDLAPTVTALFGLTAPVSWQGRSLLPALACGTLEPKAAFSELLRAPDWDHEAKSMVTPDGFHVYFRTSDSRWEVYDLAKDPDERTNIAEGHPKLDQWKQELAAWIEGPLAAGGGK